MAKKTNRRRATVAYAIGVHALANNSDPFAAKNMANNLRRHPKEATDVAEEGERLFKVKAARIQRRGVADWLSDEQIVALHTLRENMIDAHKRKTRKYAGARTGRIKAAA